MHVFKDVHNINVVAVHKALEFLNEDLDDAGLVPPYTHSGILRILVVNGHNITAIEFKIVISPWLRSCIH